MKKIIVNKPSNRIFWWALFYNCNKKCNGCVQKELPPINNSSIGFYIKLASKVRDYVKFYNYDKIYIMGGELTILKKFELITILKILSGANKKIKIFSNFTADNKYYEDLIINENIRFEFSYHNEIFTIDEYCNKLFSFLKNVKSPNIVKINYPLTEYNKKYAFEFKNKINDKVYIRFHPNLGLTKNYTCYIRGTKNIDETDKLVNSTSFPITIINDDGSKTVSNMNELRISNNTNFYNWLCTKHDTVWLYTNELRCYCSQALITKDFLNSDIKKIPCKKNHKCLSHCCQIVEEIISIEKE